MAQGRWTAYCEIESSTHHIPNQPVMKTTPIRLTFLLATAALISLCATSCHTVRGAGRDVESVGNHIERAAR